MIFSFGYDEGLIEQPVRYGQSFSKPSAKVIRKVRAVNGSRMFEADELRRILDALEGKPVEVDGNHDLMTLPPNPVLRAMTLLAINCAYGQWDVASLPRVAVDLKGGWSTFPRPKTGIPRRAKLWPETVVALQSVSTCRPAPRDQADADLVFLTAKGKRWVRASGGDNPARWKFRTDLIGNDFGKVLDCLWINDRHAYYATGRRTGGFAVVRHSGASLNSRVGALRRLPMIRKSSSPRPRSNCTSRYM
jgi:hypothetical protein